MWGVSLKRLKSEPRWTFRIFFIFFRSGRGKGESEAPGGGGIDFLLKIPGGGGGGLQDRRGRGAGRVSAVTWGILRGGGGGQNIFFGAEMSTKEPKGDCLTQEKTSSHF